MSNLKQCPLCSGKGIIHLDLCGDLVHVYCETCDLSVPTVDAWESLPRRIDVAPVVTDLRFKARHWFIKGVTAVVFRDYLNATADKLEGLNE